MSEVSRLFSFMETDRFILFGALCVIGFVLLNRNYRPVNIFWQMVYIMLVGATYANAFYNHAFSFTFHKDTDFYRNNYVDIAGLPLKNEHKRNVILIFVESFNDEFKKSAEADIKINDENAVSFDNFIEGSMQRWTQGAMFSAFTGTHINYIADYWRYKSLSKTFVYKPCDDCTEYNDAYFNNAYGEEFAFRTPKLSGISKVDRRDGYQNIFVQGGDIDFAGTHNFLLANGYLEENIIGEDKLEQKFGRQNVKESNTRIGVGDEQVFATFAEKISSLDANRPFFATMFTLDFHDGYRDSLENLKRANIVNLNKFIDWYRQQPFYDNTTLIIVGDHNQMGKYVRTGAKIYNAFFNLPDYLPKDVNTHRTFNQIDMFPTVLEIMGYQLPNRKAGMGTSLFAKSQTLAEKYSYDEQENELTSRDMFYYSLWQPI